MSKAPLTFKKCHRCGEQIGWDETPNPICSDCAVERVSELEAENAKLRKCVEAADTFLQCPNPECCREGCREGYVIARAEVDNG